MLTMGLIALSAILKAFSNTFKRIFQGFFFVVDTLYVISVIKDEENSHTRKTSRELR